MPRTRDLSSKEPLSARAKAALKARPYPALYGSVGGGQWSNRHEGQELIIASVLLCVCSQAPSIQRRRRELVDSSSTVPAELLVLWCPAPATHLTVEGQESSPEERGKKGEACAIVAGQFDVPDPLGEMIHPSSTLRSL